MTEPDRSVVIVAGGRSRRLGRDKPLVEIGGRTVLTRLLEATAHIPDVVLAVRKAPPFQRALAAEGWEPGPECGGRPPAAIALRHPLGRALVIVPDAVPDLGPLAGLASGLGAARGPICVVLAGDLPFVTAELVDRLSDELAGDAARDAVLPRTRGRAQPLCAAYRRDVGRLAARLVSRASARAEAGRSVPPVSPSMMSFLDRIRVRYLAAEDLSEIGDIEDIVRGVDSRDDLAWAVEHAARTS